MGLLAMAATLAPSLEERGMYIQLLQRGKILEDCEYVPYLFHPH